MSALGLGIIGLHHQHPRWYHPLWSNLPEYKPLAIAEADEDFLKSENEFFKLDAYTDYNAILARHDIDVVAIWLPHSEMPKAVEAAAKAGKHIIVEKPCAADVAGADEIARIAGDYPKIKISAPYCWRTHPVSEQIVVANAEGKLGQITALEGRLNAGGAHRYIRDNSIWMLKASEGGGPMWNLGVHWVDFFRYLTGKEIVSVSGVVSGPHGEPPRDIEDTAQAVLKFEDGAIAMLDISYSLPDSYPNKRDIFVAIRGTGGDVAWTPNWEGTVNEFLLVTGETAETVPVTCEEIPGYCGQMAWQWLRGFAEAVTNDTTPLVTVDDIVAAVRVVNAFYRSLKSGKAERVDLNRG